MLEAERKVNAIAGNDTELNKELSKAWKLLLLSQNTDARLLAGDSGILWKPYPQLMKECMEAALEAQAISEDILRRLSKPGT